MSTTWNWEERNGRYRCGLYFIGPAKMIPGCFAVWRNGEKNGIYNSRIDAMDACARIAGVPADHTWGRTF